MDIDIDLKDRNELIEALKPVIASRIDSNSILKHNVGVYFQDIPTDPMTGQSSIDFRKAEELGYFKIDLLNLSVYSGVKSNEHLDELINKEPIWELLEERSVVENLFQLHTELNTEVCLAMKPKSLEELAIVLAIVRPGKQHLIGKSWETIKREIWLPTEAYHYKHSHAIGYGMVIVIQLNLLVEEALTENPI